MNKIPRGFTIIESICMLATIVVFALICAAIYKKQPEFFGLEPLAVQEPASSKPAK